MAVGPEIGVSALRWWLAGGSVLLLLAVAVLTLARGRGRAASPTAQLGGLGLAAVAAISLGWLLLPQPAGRDVDSERPALELRAQQLNLRPLDPGSSLACLDGLAGDTVESACEKLLFASPATVASAVSYVADRFVLLSDIDGYIRRGGTGLDREALALRRTLEADRFGFLAQVLSEGYGCTHDQCEAIKVLRNVGRVRANLDGDTFDRYLDRYQTAWVQAPESPVAEVDHTDSTAASQGSAAAPHKMVNIDFPTAASIPPVSIMNPEPTGPPGSAGASAQSATTARGRKPSARAPTSEAGITGGTAGGGQPQPDPVWTPATTPSATSATVTASSPAVGSGSPAGGPVQLNPFPAPQ